MKRLRSTVEIIDYIQERYGVTYTSGGLSKWLHRKGFRYKRPRRVPHTLSVEAQESFVSSYQDMKQQRQEDEVILFMDGVHPDHQTQHVHGWIKRSKQAYVASTGKQKRVHYMGAVSVSEEHVKHSIKEYETINSDAVIDFLDYLTQEYPGKKLTIICDQGAYHKSKETKAFVSKREDIKLVYLPPRCPNLNLIERLWKIMRENVTYNKYYKHFPDFKSAVDDFFFRKI